MKRTKLIIKEISKCTECDFFLINRLGERRCTFGDCPKPLTKSTTIPPWCLLEDVKK